MRRRLARALVLTLGVAMGAVLTHRVHAGALRVCVDEASATAVMDARIARAVAEAQGEPLEMIRFTGYGKGGDGLPPSRFAGMASSDCELIMGFPVDVSDPHLPPNVMATSAYAHTGFVIVRRRGSTDALPRDLPAGTRVGIADLDTYAGLWIAARPKLVMHVYPKTSLMLQALESRRIGAAIAWQPSLELQRESRREHADFRMAAVSDEHMAWDLVALYAPASQQAASLFNRGLYELASSGELGKLIAPYRMAVRGEGAGAAHGSLQPAIAWTNDAGGVTSVSERLPKPRRRASPPALYTEEQATSGSLAYYKNCAMCHGPLLEGQAGGYSGPALKGADFADPSYDFHLSDIFNFVAKLMPAATPGSLAPEQDVEIMAFILQQNGYPPGKRQLTYEFAEKSKVPIRYYGK